MLGKYAVEDRLSVLGFTGLKERRVDPGFDEIALGIDPEQPYRLAVDLPTDDERGIEADVVLFKGTVTLVSVGALEGSVG